MRKMLYVLMGVLLISTGVEAKSFDHRDHGVPQKANQTIIVNNYQTYVQKPDARFHRAHQIRANHARRERVHVCRKNDKTALKIAAVSAGVVGTAALLAALAR